MKSISNLKTLLITTLCSVAIIVCTQIVKADNTPQTVTGVVTDAATGNKMTGVSVIIKGSSLGTTTDVNGKYSIKNVSGSTVLEFSAVGYTTVKEKVGTRSTINVRMKAQEIALEEIAISDYHDKKAVVADMAYVSKVQENKHIQYEAEPARVVACQSPVAYVQNSEEYGSFTENSFMMAKENPLSTFSIDVDAASYANVRRYINQGQIPPKDAIRTEELINYFDYNYPQPINKQPINVIAELSDCPWNKQNRLIHIGIKAKEIPVEDLPASNLVFLIDVSGSMDEPNKLPMVKSSLKMLVNQLRDKDRVAIVVYAGAAGEVLPSTSGKEKTKINEAINKLSAGGSTAGGAGIQLAYKIAKNNFIKEGNNRVILATDGDFNVGVSSNEGLEQLIEKERKSGVFLTILGYGMGNYKDSKMQVLAQKGNGNHAYIDNLTEAKKVLVNEFCGTLFTIAKDVKLQIEFNPAKVQAYRLIGYESRLLNKEDFNNDTKDAGEMGAGHTVTALYEIIPTGVKSNIIGLVDELKYQKTEKIKTEQYSVTNELLTVKVRYKAPDGDTSEKIEVPVVDYNTPLKSTSTNFRFSAAVAEAGMLMYQSPYKSEATYTDAINLAKGAYGEDKEGYRHEFVKLLERLQLMVENQE